jgi:4-amino-4-deoxy-L-arabinose transferase-like glycosyltransferase
LEKPPLYYWVVSGAFALGGGPSVQAARSVSGAAGFLTLLLVYFWGKRAHSARAGILSMLMLATSLQFLKSSHWILIDPLLMLWTTAAAWAGWELLANRGGPRFLPALYGFLVLALWTKGLIGPVLICAGIGAYCVLTRTERPWRQVRPVWLVLALGLGLAGIAGGIYLQGGPEALHEWGWVNHVGRFLNPRETGHWAPVTYYLLALPMAVLPWLVPFGWSVAGLFLKSPAEQEAARDRRTRLYNVSLWLGGLLVLSLSSTKREIYMLPLLPPLFLEMGAVSARALDVGGTRESGGWVRVSWWIQAVLCGLWGFVPAAALAIYHRSLGPAEAVGLVMALVCAAGGLVFTARKRQFDAGIFAMASAAVFAVASLTIVAPAMEHQKDMRPMARWVDTCLAPGETVYALGADETLLGVIPFVTGRRVVACEPDGSFGAGGAAHPWPSTLILQEKGGAEKLPPVLTGYDLVQGLESGSRRRWSIWHRKEGASPQRAQRAAEEKKAEE